MEESAYCKVMRIYYKVIANNDEEKNSILSMVLPERSTLQDFMMIFKAGLSIPSRIEEITVLVNNKNVLSSSKLKHEDIIYIYLPYEDDIESVV